MVGAGNTAEVFDYGDGKVCKLFYEGYPKEAVEVGMLRKLEVSEETIEPFYKVIERYRRFEG